MQQTIDGEPSVTHPPWDLAYLVPIMDAGHGEIFLETEGDK
jgi:hypothetical protein